MTSEKEKLTQEGFCSIRDAENFSGLKRSKIYQLMESGALPYAKIGAARRIPRAALKEFLAEALVLREK